MIIFDNIGCEFTYNTNDTFTLLAALPGHSSLSLDQAGFSIPYLARNIDGTNIEYELGVGYLDKIDNKLILKDKKISISSNNNKSVDFNKKGNKQFYIFVHSVNFDNAFNNVFIENKNFTVEPRKSVYIVDVSSGYIIASLPDPSKCEAVELEFKTLGNEGSLKIENINFSRVLNSNSYTKLISTGKEWIELKDSTLSVSSLALSSDGSTFSTLGDPTGENRSLQFNNNGSFDDSSLYQGNNNKLLFGSSTENLAKHIIPSSGNNNLIINQTKDGSDFIVYGTGNAPGYPSKNLYFSYDGKLGINMPSGVNTGSIVKPSTILHIFNTLCREGIRLENRANCYPADITLYDNPFTSPRADGSTIARIVFAGKDNSSNKANFATIESKIKSSSSKIGQLDFSVSNGSSSKTTISTSVNQTKIESDNASIDINSGSINASGSFISLTGTNIGLGAVASVNISGTAIVNTSLRLPYISLANTLLSIDANNQVVATTGFKIPGLSGGSEEKLLSVKTDGTVIGEIPKNGFWPYERGQKIGGKDLIWERYPYRTAQICLNKATKELQIENSPLEEYSIGDQLAILNLQDGSITYRYITSLVIENDIITGIVIDQNVLISGNSANLKVYSVSKGGVLTNRLYSSGIVSDATDIVLSSRPNVNTVFNSRRKNIDFTVYGSERIPALNVLSNVSTGSVLTGRYFKYATQIQDSKTNDIPPAVSKIDSIGAGSLNSSLNNSVNFNDAAGSGWLSKVGIVGNNGKASFYGTFDQNGNVCEWVEDEDKQASYSSYQYTCGGSWRTKANNSLRSYIPTPRYSGLDDTGFRVCSKAGYYHNLENFLALDFVRVDNVNNPSDSTPLYTESWTNRFDDTNDQPTQIEKNNLGSVSYPFRISKYEVTNSQYVSFLNSVATGIASISGLYKSVMSTNAIGGISVSGSGSSASPFIYSVKNNMGSMPVVFVDYVSAIRYINWLSNGAPTGTNIPYGVTEVGAYIIEGGPGNTDQITKNRDQNYWLPTLDEWHKSAYYAPSDDTEQGKNSAVTIKRDSPFEYGSGVPFVTGTGNIASLSVSGYIYADNLKINNFGITDTDNKHYSSVLNQTEAVLAVSGITSFINRIGDLEDNELPVGRVFLTPEKTIFSQSILITSGDYSTSDSSKGLLLTAEGLTYVDDNGAPVSGGFFPGPNAGYLFKDPDTGSLIVSSDSNLKVEKTSDNKYYAKLDSIGTGSDPTAFRVICNNGAGLLSTNSYFSVGDQWSALSVSTSDIVSVRNIDPSGIPALLYTDSIIVGPILSSFSGSLLTHNGNAPAYWQENTFLNAPGASWNRYSKRTIEFGTVGDQIRTIKFITLDPSKGGTGDVSLEDIKKEFAVNETIALYNLNRQVIYVKVANIGLLDSRESEIHDSMFTDEGSLTLTVCPAIPRSFIVDSKLDYLPEDDPDYNRVIGYAFSIQKGAYLDMDIEPKAIETFACQPQDVANSEYRFKPSTANTISIRPSIHTAFNKRAEDIDFVVYGHRKTLFTRYEPEWFNQDSHGVPTGIEPAFRIHSKLDNSYVGSISSGILRDTIGETNLVASGVYPDLKPKITINTNQPYVISSLVNIKKGVLLPEASDTANLIKEKTFGTVIPETGVLLTSSGDLSNYADLTVNGVTYTDALISKDIVLGPLWTGSLPIPYELSLNQKIYAPNYPLTINNLGQIVSLIPPPTPEAPSAPRNLVTVPKNNSVILFWDIPEDDGGEPIVGYIVEFSIDSGSNWIVSDQIDAQTLLPSVADNNTLRILVSPTIVNNTEYLFRVRAYNSVGLGTYSAASTGVIPSTTISPAAPDNLTISVGQNSFGMRTSSNVTLTWSPVTSLPSNVTLEEYIVEYWIYDTLNNKDIKFATWTSANNSPVPPNTTSIQITGLNTSSLYYFSVIAKGSNGSLSNRTIYVSLGTDPDPRPVGSRPSTANNNQYNFGSVVFIGSCS